jgi:DNA polymerase III sliding clamp (beta) subunit (PCNA family)
VYRTELEAPSTRDFERTLPARALQELAKLAKVAGTDHLTISQRNSSIVMEFASITLSTRTIDGT